MTKQTENKACRLGEKYGRETTQGNKYGDEDGKSGETGNNAVKKE
jgi:hypothetical protein